MGSHIRYRISCRSVEQIAYNYRIAYTHPKHMEQAIAEVNKRNAEMLAQFNNHYSQPWV
jgi:hypothetical protein